MEMRLVGPFHNTSGYARAGRALLAAACAAGIRTQAVESESDWMQTGWWAGRDSEGDPVFAVTERRIPKFTGRPIAEVQRRELEAALATEVTSSAPTLLLTPPDGLAGWPEYCGGRRIGLTMLEADRLHPFWARAARNVDLLLTPSRWCLETLRRSVSGTPVRLLPLCVDERLWEPGPYPRECAGGPGYLFFSVFSTCARKGWQVLLQAFGEEFAGEDVGLVVKPTRCAEVEELAAWVRTRGVSIEVLGTGNEGKSPWTDAEMASAYRAADCYVLPSAEGFGLTFVEAMLCGRPVIGLDAGGAADLVHEENGYPVRSIRESCVGLLPHVYPSAYRRPACTVAALRRALRRAFTERDRAKGARGRERALAEFGRAAIGARLADLITEQASGSGRVSCYRSGPFCTPRFGDGRQSGLRRGHRRRSKGQEAIAIVTTYNHRAETRRCVAALRRFSPGMEIILADDGSTDGTSEWAHAGGLRLISGGTPGNVSANRQRAVDAIRGQAAGRYLIFLDNDVEVTEGWWAALSALFAERPEAGILAPCKFYRKDGSIQNAGNRLRWDGSSFPVKLMRRLVWPDYVESACMAVRPAVWSKVVWDPQFPLFYEDVDYCFQARAIGWEIAATAAAAVRHAAHTTSAGRMAESERNRRRFLRKWREEICDGDILDPFGTDAGASGSV